MTWPGFVQVPIPDKYRVLGRYQITRVMGKGGFGITYLAHDTVLGRDVSLKEFFPQHADVTRDNKGNLALVKKAKYWTPEMMGRWMDRFIREGQVLAQVSHPNIVRIWDIFQSNRSAFLVEEYVPGKDLFHHLQGARLPEDHVEAIGEQLVAALGHIHDKRFFHLDISPSNIMITRKNRPVLIDFGAAKPERTGAQTTTVMKPGYTPPELTAPERTNIGPHTDLYQLAVVVHEMLVGSHPPHWSTWNAGYELSKKVPLRWHELLMSGLNPTVRERPSDVRKWWRKLGQGTRKATEVAAQEKSDTVRLGGKTCASCKEDADLIARIVEITGYTETHVKQQLRKPPGNAKVKTRFAKRWPGN